MKHIGDITKLHGDRIEAVDVISGGSPCQNLSVAGGREGLEGSQSRLFFDMVRIIKEMRENDKRQGRSGLDVRPRFMVFENVTGLLSSGDDFRIVLESIARIADEAAIVPRPPRGEWSPSGAIVGDGWSIAWRVHDAKFWGVAQRRKRLAIVADFADEWGATEVLFESKGLHRNPTESRGSREEIARPIEGSVRGSIESEINPIAYRKTGHPRSADEGQGWERTDCNDTLNTFDMTEARSPTIVVDPDRTEQSRTVYDARGNSWAEDGQGISNKTQRICFGISSHCSHSMLSNNPTSGYYEADTARTLDNNCGNPACNQGGIAVVEQRPKNKDIQSQVEVYDARGNSWTETAPTLTGDHQRRVTDYTALIEDGGDMTYQKLTGPLMANSHPGSYSGQDAYSDMFITERRHDKQAILSFQERGGKEGGGKGILIQKDEVGAIASSATQRVQVETAVRRLTPLEAERLQGFPDGWTDIGEWTDSKGRTRQTTDSARYKALGNSIAVGYANEHRGFWMWLMKRITERLGRTGTLGSLFDGIGGFPLAWETYNGKGSARWASEIEDFCIAVTKKRFGEE